MARKVTEKTVQTHFECVCGYNVVDHELLTVRWSDLPKLGIVRRIDVETRKTFLLMKMKAEECNCHNDF